MDAIGFHLYKDRWVLTSAEQVIGGATLDTAPVRIVEHSDRDRLRAVIEELLKEEPPLVPQPDYNDRRFTVGIRAEALGLKSWRTFAKDARCFNLERRKNGNFLLEEWPKEGGSFSARPSWQREFPPEGLPLLVDYLIEVTTTDAQQRVPPGAR
jgi:hypothetical protein